MSDWTRQQMQMLQELAQMGMDLARLVHREAMERAESAPEPAAELRPEPARSRAADLGLVHARIAWSVQRTMALQARLIQDHQAGSRRTGADQAAQVLADVRAQSAARRAAIRRKHELRDIIESVIEAQAAEDDAETLLAGLDERLDHDEYEVDFGMRPIGEQVSGICRDLGVTLESSLWADEPPAAPGDAPPVRARSNGSAQHILDILDAIPDDDEEPRASPSEDGASASEDGASPSKDAASPSPDVYVPVGGWGHRTPPLYGPGYDDDS